MTIKETFSWQLGTVWCHYSKTIGEHED